MKRIFIISLLSIALLMSGLLPTGCNTADDENLSADVQTSEDDYKQIESAGITFKWKIIGDRLHVTILAPTKGWVAVGFNPKQMMQGADIIIGYVKDGAALLEDHYGTSTTGHEADIDVGGMDDIGDAAGKEDEAGTELSFSIPLDSGDVKDGVLTAGSKVTLILGYGADDDFTSYHTDRTVKVIDL